MAQIADIPGAPLATHARQRAPTVGTLAKLSVFNDLSLERPRRDARRIVTPANHGRTLANRDRAAVIGFLDSIEEWTGPGEMLAFKWWVVSYRAWQRETGAPELSDKVLSLGLQDAGCRRVMRDERRKGKGRYVAFAMRGCI